MSDVHLAEALLFASRLTETEARAVAAQIARAAAEADLAAARAAEEAALREVDALRAIVRARGYARAVSHFLNSSKV